MFFNPVQSPVKLPFVRSKEWVNQAGREFYYVSKDHSIIAHFDVIHPTSFDRPKSSTRNNIFSISIVLRVYVVLCGWSVQLWEDEESFNSISFSPCLRSANEQEYQEKKLVNKNKKKKKKYINKTWFKEILRTDLTISWPVSRIVCSSSFLILALAGERGSWSRLMIGLIFHSSYYMGHWVHNLYWQVISKETRFLFLTHLFIVLPISIRFHSN